MDVQQDPPEEQTLEQQPEGLESLTPPSIPPTPTPPAPLTKENDPRYLGLLEGTVQAQNRRLAELERQLLEKGTEPPKPPRTAEEERQDYFNNPQAATRALIREELNATITPIAEFVKQFKGASNLDKLIDNAKLNPRFAGHLTPNVEAYIRDQASQIKDQSQVNETNFNFLIVSAIGMKAAGMIPDDTQPSPIPPTPTPTPTPVPTPPYMAPSAPPAPRPPSSKQNFQPLTEDERRILREYNQGKPQDKQMTEQQYREWQSAPDESIAFSTIGKPVKK